MIAFLRFIGVVNAAIWFGSAIFFTAAVAPAFYSEEMVRVLSLPYAGFAAQIVSERYFVLHHVCGGIALVHLLAEWLYMGRPLERITLGVVGGVFALGLLGGLWLQPKLKELHLTRYHGEVPEQRQQAAARSFRIWSGVSQTANVAMTIGLLFYLWRVTNPSGTARFNVPKFTAGNIFRG